MILIYITYLILSDVPEYPHRLSICWKRQTVCSLPVIEHRGISINATGGFGFTVKCKNNDTHSRSVKMPDWAGPCANSSTVINGNRICLKTLPNTLRLLSELPEGKLWREHSASDHLNTAENNLASLIRNESLSSTADSVSGKSNQIL